MKKTSKIIIAVILVAVLLLGIGYAAIQNITLNIKGTASADPSQSNFKVMFSGTPTVSDEAKVTAAVTDDINATMNVVGLTTLGETVTATYTVQNASTDLSADLSVATTNSNTEYFTLKAVIAKTSLVAGEATTLTVTVELTKLPVSETVSSTIGVQLTAMPVQPGEEGTSEGINGSSSTPISTLAKVTNANIGDYVDLGHNAPIEDWRILYVENDTVYVILDGFLPTSLIDMETLYDWLVDGVTITGDYGFYASNGSGNYLYDALNHSTIWDSLSNGYSDEVIGGPTMELLMKSYNAANGTDENYHAGAYLDSSAKQYDLFVKSISNENITGYWSANLPVEVNDYPSHVWFVRGDGYVGYRDVSSTDCGIRPVIALSKNIKADFVNGEWVLSK